MSERVGFVASSARTSLPLLTAADAGEEVVGLCDVCEAERSSVTAGAAVSDNFQSFVTTEGRTLAAVRRKLLTANLREDDLVLLARSFLQPGDRNAVTVDKLHLVLGKRLARDREIGAVE